MNPSRVASRFLQAAIFEPPPNMLAAAIDAVRRIWGQVAITTATRLLKDLKHNENMTYKYTLARLQRELSEMDVRLDRLAKDSDVYFTPFRYAGPQEPDSNMAYNHMKGWKSNAQIWVSRLIEGEAFDPNQEFLVFLDSDGDYNTGSTVPRDRAMAITRAKAKKVIRNAIESSIDMVESGAWVFRDPEAKLNRLLEEGQQYAPGFTVSDSAYYQEPKINESIPINFTGWKYIPEADREKSERVVKDSFLRLVRRESIVITNSAPNAAANTLGHWDERRGEIWVRFIDRSDQVNSVLERKSSIEMTVRHEMQHFAQTALRYITGSPNAGMPPRVVRHPEAISPDGVIKDPPNAPHKHDWDSIRRDPINKQLVIHELRDIEFQTRLADEVDRFMAIINKGEVPVEHWGDLIKKFTATKENLTSPNGFWFLDFDWNESHWFRTIKHIDKTRWREAVSKFVDEIGKRGVLDKIKRPAQWAPFSVPTHDAWGMPIMAYWMMNQTRHTWPEIRKRYADFVDSLSTEQLVEHKRLVREKYGYEYWVTPRLQEWDGKGPIKDVIPGSVPDHPRMPKRYRY